MGRNWKQNDRRFRYRKMTAAEFHAALDHLEMTVAVFAFLTGAREDRVERWKRGEEDIPQFVPGFCSLLTLPGAIPFATRVAAHYQEDAEAS